MPFIELKDATKTSWQFNRVIRVLNTLLDCGLALSMCVAIGDPPACLPMFSTLSLINAILPHGPMEAGQFRVAMDVEDGTVTRFYALEYAPDAYVEGELLVHLLEEGRTHCRRPGAPSSWLPGESWVASSFAADPAIQSKICPACQEAGKTR